MEAIMELLDVRSGGVRFVGIHGMGGVGKTTLAKVMFNKLISHFERSSFLEDVRASSQSHGGLLELQKKLLSDLTGHGIANKIKDGDDGINMIKKALSNKEVLIVLDDLDKKEQLKNLAGKSDWFCFGSRIIITTRDESVLMAQGGVFSKEVLNQPEGILRYEVCGMRFDLALHLFYKHAFRSDSAPEEYGALSTEIVRTSGHASLGRHGDRVQSFDWGKDLEHSDKREVWDETLKKLKEGPFKDVQDTLMISYERLEDKHQEIFLDIACFFITTDKTYPVIMWKDCGYFPSIAMRVLSQRSFIKIKEDNRFWMHDQVRDFGRYIVLQIYPRKFCRVWIPKDALKLLEGEKDLSRSNIEDDWGGWSQMQNEDKGVSHTIGGLEMLEVLDAHKAWDLTDKNLEEIGKLFHLKTLILAFTSVSRLPPEISRLHLQKLDVGSIDLQQVPSLPSSLKFLVVQAMDFSVVPHPSSITDLEQLELYRFSNLRRRHHSTRRDYDSKLKAALMREQPCYQLPSHLSDLKLKSISPLPHFSNLLNLRVLHVIECPISRLPVTLGLIHLRKLYIIRCECLEEIPGLSLLRSLERLELKGLNRLVEIQGLSELENLQYLLLSSCDLIGQLPNLSKLGSYNI
ncbi:TMV resistance protein N-like [Eucalyptus grandis]|uniref:TMV resistance protein N-like n=1 Tax=Eucalyptus grandis TaxID=71139 RepID=UPI00192ECB9A|nr:TMV resistance protein N-like [Eucalyptus grandis]